MEKFQHFGNHVKDKHEIAILEKYACISRWFVYRIAGMTNSYNLYTQAISIYIFPINFYNYLSKMKYYMYDRLVFYFKPVGLRLTL